MRSLARLKTDPGDPASVHHFRTTIRRLRSLLSSFKEVAPVAERKALNGRLRTLSQRYAALRQWDAFIETVAGDKAGAHARTRRLLAEAAKKRRRALVGGNQQPLARDVATVDREIDKTEWLHTPTAGDTEIWNERIEDYATELLDRQWRKLRRDSRKLDLSDSLRLPQIPHRGEETSLHHRDSRASLYRKKEVKPYLQPRRRLAGFAGRHARHHDGGGIGRPARPGAHGKGFLAHKWLERRRRVPQALSRARQGVQPRNAVLGEIA